MFVGKCNGPWSACYHAGYALESKCHIAHRCTYRVTDARTDIRLHRISTVIQRVLVPEDVPDCEPVRYPVPSDSAGHALTDGGDSDGGEGGEDEDENLCRDCLDWQFIA